MRLSTRLSPSSDGAVAAATVRRVRLADSTTGKLFFAQVHCTVGDFAQVLRRKNHLAKKLRLEN